MKEPQNDPKEEKPKKKISEDHKKKLIEGRKKSIEKKKDEKNFLEGKIIIQI